MKYHFHPREGVHSFVKSEAKKVPGEDLGSASKDLFDAIKQGNFPKWDLFVQLMSDDEHPELDWDPLDDTKIWPEDQFPLRKVGTMTLNRNVEEFFAENEQIATGTGELVDGLDFSDGKMLVGRTFSCSDTQRHRVGTNYLQLPRRHQPARRPDDAHGGHRRREPARQRRAVDHGGLQESDAHAPIHQPEIHGKLTRSVIDCRNDYAQARARFVTMNDRERDDYGHGVARALGLTARDVRLPQAARQAGAHRRRPATPAAGFRLVRPFPPGFHVETAANRQCTGRRFSCVVSDSSPQRSTAETEQLLVSYETRGPAHGPPVLLLHGWPDDPRTWDRVAAHLAAAGFRTVVPATRGCGATSFRDAAIPRTAEVTTLAHDALELLDALGIRKATVIGHDWGARAAYALAALWPERVEKLVGLASPYETGIKPGSKLNYDQGKAHWYQWFFASERGREALQDNRRALCRHCWQHWSPTWKFTEEEFATTAASWDNPDWVAVTLHSYRMRWGNAPKDARSKTWEAELEKHPPIQVPTVQIHGALDGATLTSAVAGQAEFFSGPFEQKLLPGIGHFIPREAPAAVVEAVSD